MKIVIIASNAKNFIDQFDSNDVRYFESVARFKDTVERTTVVADVTIILDNILGSIETKGLNKVNLKKALDYPLFKTKKLFFVARESSDSELEYFKGLAELLSNKSYDIEVRSFKRILMSDLTDLVANAFGYNNEDGEVENTYLVKHRKDDINITTNEIEELRTSGTKTIVVNLSTANNYIVNAKLPFQKNERTLQTVEEHEDPIEALEQFISASEVQEEVIEESTKVFVVTGRAGVSTTALTLARSSIEFGKTLLIDADYETLGASYIVQQRPDEFAEDDLEVLRLEEIINTANLVNVKSKSMSQKRLHLLKLSLHVVDRLGIKEFEGCLIQLLTFLKNNYSQIIIDLPHRLLGKYTLLFQSADAIIEVVAPYKNKFVPSFKELSQYPIIQQFVETGKLIIYRAGINDTNKLEAFSRNDMMPYILEFFKKQLPVSRIYVHEGSYNVPSDYKQIYDKIFREEVVH